MLVVRCVMRVVCRRSCALFIVRCSVSVVRRVLFVVRCSL